VVPSDVYMVWFVFGSIHGVRRAGEGPVVGAAIVEDAEGVEVVWGDCVLVDVGWGL
jgi:hypothetical protein